MLVSQLICVLIRMVGYRRGRLWPLAAGADSIRVLGRRELGAGREFPVEVITNLGSVDGWTPWSEDQCCLLGQSHRLVWRDQRALYRRFRDRASTVRVCAVLVAHRCRPCHFGNQSCGFNLV